MKYVVALAAALTALTPATSDAAEFISAYSATGVEAVVQTLDDSLTDADGSYSEKGASTLPASLFSSGKASAKLGGTDSHNAADVYGYNRVLFNGANKLSSEFNLRGITKINQADTAAFTEVYYFFVYSFSILEESKINFSYKSTGTYLGGRGDLLLERTRGEYRRVAFEELPANTKKTFVVAPGDYYVVVNSNFYPGTTEVPGSFDQYLRQRLNLSISAVPEPATWAMMILGFGAVGGAMRQRARVAITNDGKAA